MVKKILFLISLIIVIIVCFMNIEITVEATKNSLETFYNFVLPYMLPFIFLIQIFINLGGGILIAYLIQKPSSILLKISGYEALIILCSILSGYPSISIYSESFYLNKKIDKNSALKLINYASFPSVFFVLGSLHKFIDNPLVLRLIFLSIISSGFLILRINKNCSIIISKNDLNHSLKQLNFNKVLLAIKSSIFNTSKSIILILSSFIFYSILSSIIYVIFPSDLTKILCSFLEFSNGVFTIAKMDILLPLKYNLVIFCLVFGGMSILSQIETNLTTLKLDYKDYFLSKIKHAFCACLLFKE